jgi:hypothetical protein
VNETEIWKLLIDHHIAIVVSRILVPLLSCSRECSYVDILFDQIHQCSDLYCVFVQYFKVTSNVILV